MSIFPFGDIREFERFRALAMQDAVAAKSMIRLHQSSGGRSTVRVYFGPPGTGKTLAAVQLAVKLADPTFPGLDDPAECFRHFSGPIADRVRFITFHQALQYEDVVESIRPKVSNSATATDSAEGEEGESEGTTEPSALTYEMHDGPVMAMIRRATEFPDEEHVVVIDEINRGDISRILGPLISSIEPDKRLGAEFPVGFEAQYPRADGLGSRVFVPANLHFVGTMNSADRNIALVDHALRRRFEFVEVPPEPQLLGSTNDEDQIDLRRLLESLNSRVSFLLGSDHAIGHAYFMGCESNEELIERFARRVIPLLTEYFFGNEAGLLLVLNERPEGSKNIFVASTQSADFKDLFGRSVDEAMALGYRGHGRDLSLAIDPRFWDTASIPPGPGEIDFAVAAIRKIYESGTDEPPNVEDQSTEEDG